jgi:4-alpha-glucanotransferase
MSVYLQDIMRLDNCGRMNLPGSVENNWTWRIGDSDVWKKLAPEAKTLKKLGETYDRLPGKSDPPVKP